MAINTENKRRSVIGMVPGLALIGPVPDGVIDAADRRHLLGLYSYDYVGASVPEGVRPRLKINLRFGRSGGWPGGWLVKDDTLCDLELTCLDATGASIDLVGRMLYLEWQLNRSSTQLRGPVSIEDYPAARGLYSIQTGDIPQPGILKLRGRIQNSVGLVIRSQVVYLAVKDHA